MSKTLLSRRGFIKGVGTAVLAAACSGMLSGCSGSDGTSSTDSTEATLVDYKVNVVDVDTSKNESTLKDENGLTTATYTLTPAVKVKYTGDGFTAVPFSSVFSAYINGKELTLENKTDLVTGVNVLDYTKTYYPIFSTDDEDAVKAFEYNIYDIELHVTFNQQTAVYLLTYASTKFDIKLSNG